jgi:hypothetical protein
MGFVSITMSFDSSILTQRKGQPALRSSGIGSYGGDDT